MGYKKFDAQDLVISNDSVAGTVWSNNQPTLTNYFTSSLQEASNTGLYYLSVYQTESSLNNSSIQFDISFAHSKGSGSAFYNDLVTGSSPSKTVYGQFRSQVLGDENSSFVFGNQSSSYFYVINVERARFKEKLLPGSLTMHISGSAGQIKITDDSQLNSSQVYTDAGRRYDLVSGSSGTVYTGDNSNGWTVNSGSYGWFLPDVGLMLLNGEALDGGDSAGGVSLGTGLTFDTNSTNPQKLFTSLKISGNSSNGFTINSEETISSNYFFIRPRNQEYNYSTNPSFISGSTGELVYSSFIESPQVYITTVGLYNDRNELLAVAKLSRPLPKNFTKEILIRAKLDF